MTNQLEPKIIEKSSFLVAGLHYEGKNEHGEIPALWDNEFLPRMGELAFLQAGAGAYGIARAMPNFEKDGVFEYLAAVEVKSFDNLPPGMVGWEIPAATYVVLPAHDVPGIAPVSDYFYQKWLPQSKEYEMGEGAMLEYYPPDFGVDLNLDLFFPVRHKTK